MSILAELKKRNVDIIKSDHFFRGLYTTEKGVVVSMTESKCDDKIFFLEDRKGMTFPCNDKIVYIISGTEYEGKVKSKEEVEQLANEGKIFSFKCTDLYSEYYDLRNNRDLECCLKHGYSYRSRKYIEGVMENIGLEKYTDANNGSMCDEGVPTEIDVEYQWTLFFNADTNVGKLDDDTWIAQTCFRIDIDDFVVIKMYFNHSPSQNDLETAFAIRQFELKPVEVFYCWECGKMTNWLELEGDINKKYEMSRENYCGC